MFKFPYTNLHELNLDWILDKVKTLVANNDEFNEKADYAVETADEAKTIAEQAAQASIADGSVTTIKLADRAVTGIKIALSTIQTENLASACVENAQIKDSAVTSIKISDGAVTGNKIAQSTIQTGNLSSGCVTKEKILDGAISLTKLDETVSNLVNDYLNIGINGSADSKTVYLPNGYKGYGFVLAASDSAKDIFLINVTSTGAVTIAPVLNSTYMTNNVTTGTNTITFGGSSNYPTIQIINMLKSSKAELQT